MKKIIFLLLCVNFLLAYNVDSFNDEISNDVLKIQEILKQDGNNKSEDLFNLLNHNLDIDLMSNLVLSKKYFSKLNDKEVIEFKDLFINRLKKDFSSKIDLVKGSSLKLIDASFDDKKCQANMQVFYENQEKNMVFKFRRIQNDCKLYDIEILDTSLIASYRSQFLDIINQNGISALFEKLK
ncbi:MlaC/ttg2D family ABC transporter substrate-binding protein [Campylobacter sp. MG1]|uniref:MlaC/ttg2D family ABC transporter substrate-binding protein n=1 Tax=Campylobacter sp. MG1 TaxID=2976332 RepID=UPI00226C8C3B|nr:ABC transporter substrate-binding protein [Campylobacter sp. MG1]